MTLSRALEIFLNLEKPCVFSGYRLAHPKPVAVWRLQHLSCELKIDDCNPRRCLCSLLSTRASVRRSSLFGSPEEMKLAVVRSLAWWFVVDLFSTKCAPHGLFCFDLLSEDLPWRLFRVSTKTQKLVLKEILEINLLSFLIFQIRKPNQVLIGQEPAPASHGLDRNRNWTHYV